MNFCVLWEFGNKKSDRFRWNQTFIDSSSCSTVVGKIADDDAMVNEQ